MAGPTLAGKVTLDDSQASAALRRLETAGVAAAAKLEASMGGAFRSIGKVAAVGTAAAAAAVAAGGVMVARGVGQIFESGRALEVLSRQTGAGVAGLAVLQAKFKEAGLDADGVGRAIFRLQKSIAGLEDDENKGGASKIQQLGLSLAALQTMKPDQQLMAVGAAISKIADPAERSGAAMQIFGRAGAELGALFNGGDFVKIPPNLAMNAQILARNAAIFEQVSIRLERIGAISKSFYLGAAAAMANTLGPVLDQLERLNLVAVGAKFGAAIADGAKVLVGAFQLPDTAFDLVRIGLGYAFTSAGNVLLASLKTGAEFFQTGMVAALEGIGSAIVSTLMQSFERPIAYLQAGIERAMRPITVQQDAELVADLKKERNQIAENAQGRRYTPAETSHLKAVIAQISEIQNKHRTNLSLSERADQIQKAGVRFGMYGGGQTSAEWGARARDSVQDAFAAAKVAASHFKVEDVLGASRLQEDGLVAAAKLRQRGSAVLGTGVSPSAGPEGSLSAAAGTRLLAAAHMALASSRAPIGADPAAYMFLGHSGMPGTARTNASDPYTTRVDAERRAYMRAAHTIGIGGALDGHDTSLRTGGLGGGAYGATGNIWNQISGRVGGGSKTTDQHVATIAGHVQTMKDDMKALRRTWEGGGGSSGGGGGPTITG